MTPKLEEALIRDFPELFRDHDKPMSQTAICWGCECGDGWEPIIRDACYKLSKLEPVPVFDQIKEKFGSLRIYFHGGPPSVPKLWKRWAQPLAYVWFFFVQLRYQVFGSYRSQHFFRAVQNRVWSWHLTGSTCESDDIVDAAERESAMVCEVCGARGTINYSGWLSCLCGPCRKETK